MRDSNSNTNHPYLVFVIFSIAAIVFACIALRSPSNETYTDNVFNKTMSIAGIIIGVFGVVATVYFVIMGIEIQGFKKEVDDYRKEIDKQIDDYKKGVDDYKKEIDKGVDDYKKEIDKQIDDYKKGVNDYKKEFNDYKKEIDDYKKEIRCSKDEIAETMRSQYNIAYDLLSSVEGETINKKYLRLARGRLICKSPYSSEEEKQSGIAMIQEYSIYQEDINLLQRIIDDLNSKEKLTEKEKSLKDNAEEAIKAINEKMNPQ